MKTSDENEPPFLFTAEWLSQYQIPIIASAAALICSLMCCGCGGWLFSGPKTSPKEIAKNKPSQVEKVPLQVELVTPEESPQPIPSPPVETKAELIAEAKIHKREEAPEVLSDEEAYIKKLRATASKKEEFDLFLEDFEDAFHENRIKGEKDFNYHYLTLDGESYDLRRMEDNSFILLFRVWSKDAAGRSITVAALFPPSQEDNLSKLFIGDWARVRGIVVYDRKKDLVRLLDSEVIKTPKALPKKPTNDK